MTTFNTPFGRYQFTRLPYGVNSAQEVFHKRINQSFDGISQVKTDIDDMLIWGHSDDDHNRCLISCLEKAQKIGMPRNAEKCKFKETKLIYLGHKLTVNVIEPDQNKIKSILEIPKPEHKKDVQRLLGLRNYVEKFIRNLSEFTAPLRELLVKNKLWQWGKSQNQSFERIKELLVSTKCLVYYDVQKPLKTQVDASKSGIGAALLQDDRSVAYTSNSLTATRQRYAPVEQEMLAVVFGCLRFHQYIYGKKVTIQGDHKPLEAIMKKPLQNTPPPLQRILLSLQKYDIDLAYLAGKENIWADLLPCTPGRDDR